MTDPERLKLTAATVAAVTFAGGAAVGYHVTRRHQEPARLLAAAVAGVIAVPVIFVVATLARAREATGSG